MKQMTLFASVMMTLFCSAVVTAADLVVNNTEKHEAITDAATIGIEQKPTVTEGAIVVLNADVSFTIPDETPDYDEVTGEKFALAVDTDGKILIADGATQDWIKTDVKIDETKPVSVRAEGKVNDAGKLVFTVTLDEKTYSNVTSPATGTQLATIQTVGEGTVSGLSLALVDTAALPGGSDANATVDADLLADYTEWVTKVLAGKMPGEALPEGVVAEDAFVMNVAGKPELKIESVDPIEGKITLVGTSTIEGAQGDVVTTVSLENINGEIYISWTDSLNGTVTVSKADVLESSKEKFVLNWPDAKARFIKAAVSREAPVAPASL